MDSWEDKQEQAASASPTGVSAELTELEKLLADQTAVLDKAEAAPDLFAPIEQLISTNQGKDPMLGKRLAGRYEIIDILGQGGMSIVYKARQAMVDRMVAIKTMKVQLLADDKLVKRFDRELKSLSRLNHPHIVTIYDYILGDNGHPYIVMDYLEGKSLADLLKEEGRLTPLRARHIFRQVCSAVEHAHKNRIVHRDLKPGNIMLIRQSSDPDFVKVVDFGVAKLGEDSQKLTQTGELWGSPLYMSPEQCGGFVLGPQSDIYSLGIVMYQSLTGSVPFRGNNFMDTLSKQLRETPPKFVEIDPAIQIPAELEQVVLKTLNKDPKDRYQSMAELKDAIEGAVSVGDEQLTSSTKRVTLITPRLPSKSGSSMETTSIRGGIIAVSVAGALLILALALSFINSYRTSKSPNTVSVMTVPQSPSRAPIKPPPNSKAESTPSAQAATPNTVMTSNTVLSPAPLSVPQKEQSPIAANSQDKSKTQSGSTHQYSNSHASVKYKVHDEKYSTADGSFKPETSSLSVKSKHPLTDDERWYKWMNSDNRSDNSR